MKGFKQESAQDPLPPGTTVSSQVARFIAPHKLFVGDFNVLHRSQPST